MFEIGPVLTKGFESFKANVAAWILAILAFVGVSIVVSLVGQVILGVIVNAVGSQIVAILGIVVLQVVNLVVSTFFTMGLINMGLKCARNQTVAVGDLFSQGGKMVPGILTQLIVTIVVMIGFILLIIPGIIASIVLCFSLFFVVDKELDPISAIKASVAATEGSRLQIFLFGLVAFLLYIVGAIPCGLGEFVVIPTLIIGFSHVYEQLSAKAASA